MISSALWVIPACVAGLNALTYGPQTTVSLDGEWNFVPDPEGTLTEKDCARSDVPRVITVPGCWEAMLPELVEYEGVAWYWRQFEVPQE